MGMFAESVSISASDVALILMFLAAAYVVIGVLLAAVIFLVAIGLSRALTNTQFRGLRPKYVNCLVVAAPMPPIMTFWPWFPVLLVLPAAGLVLMYAKFKRDRSPNSGLPPAPQVYGMPPHESPRPRKPSPPPGADNYGAE